MYIKMMYNHGRLFALAQEVGTIMAGTRKWWSVKKIGGELKTVQAVDIRSAALKTFGLNPARHEYGIWFDSQTRIAQVTKHTKHGTVIVGAVAIYNEGV